ncbi:hypothetical protein K432DRAFT_457335 [Lepidopterella palustris CBS 459.81]|uniref:Uncharacterized protein n=1 Tax=Lepidopterella palustris CBS 459.81 TaxID=1314670 RepID=A0A8E2E772_9PEZI|nr:hypothetical protein K432DRAFT_457335 [Lepidopterella palustris CBS 459.81]
MSGRAIPIFIYHPYLMHALLTLTLMHDRSLSALTTPLSATEAFHWYPSVALFNTKLSGPVQPSDRDPLWVTAMSLGIISFYIEASTPEYAWPLVPTSATDPNWLKMTDGKREVWRVAGPPMGRDNLFQKPFRENIKSLLLPFERTWGWAPFLPNPSLYSFNMPLADDDNPYRTVAILLAQTLHIDDPLSIIVGFLSFICNMLAEYKRLLEQRNSRALQLLAYCYAKICQFQHWRIYQRAALEG